MSVTLVTNRLALRPWRDDDLEPFVAMSADPAVMEHIGDGTPRSAEDATASFENVRSTWQSADGAERPGLFALERLDDERFIGFCGLSSPDFLPELLPTLEIGWRLDSSTWGNGYATEAASAVLDWAFATDGAGLDRVVAAITLGNERSVGVAQRLGMTVERRTIIPAHQSWVDIYELDAPTWAGNGT